MQQLGLSGRIGAQCNREAALRAGQPSCTLDQAHAPGGQAHERPPRRTLFGGGSLGLLSQLGVVAAVLIGVTAGGGDLAAGVFRELVVTGRPRFALFAARIPGGLALLLPAVAVGFSVAATASVALAGPGPAPGGGLLLEYVAWLALVMSLGFVLALGVSSLLDSRATSIGILLTWQLAVAPLLLQTGKLDPILLGAALKRFEPGAGSPSLSLTTAIVVIGGWTIAPLAAGAWRTHTRDA